VQTQRGSNFIADVQDKQTDITDYNSMPQLCAH